MDSRNEQINSLKERITNLIENGEYDIAETLAQEALTLSKKTPQYLIGQGDALFNLGMILLKKKNFDKAETFFKQSFYLRERIGNFNDAFESLRRLGLVYIQSGRIANGKDCFNQALGLTEKHGNLEKKAVILNELGIVNWQLGDFLVAEKYYHQSIEIFE